MDQNWLLLDVPIADMKTALVSIQEVVAFNALELFVGFILKYEKF